MPLSENQPFSSLEQVETLVQSFRDHTLPAVEWTHAAHLTVALWHLSHHSLEESAILLRAGIITYNAATGTPNSPAKGYHETLTLFWLHTSADFLRQHAHLNPLERYNLFPNHPSGQAAFPLRFYSRQTLFSTRARAFWVEPDL